MFTKFWSSPQRELKIIYVAYVQSDVTYVRNNAEKVPPMSNFAAVAYKLAISQYIVNYFIKKS